MGLPSKMLAIAAWGLFLYLPSVVQGLNINSSVVPAGFSSPVTVQLFYQNDEIVLPPLCGNNITLPRSDRTVNLNSPVRQVVPAAQVQRSPKVLTTGLESSATYTYVFGDVSALQAIFGTRDKPLLYDMRVNIVGSDFSSGVGLDPYLAPIPEWGYTAEVHIFIFRQPSVLSDCSIEPYVNTGCGVGLRCAFDILKYIQDKGLTLVFAGGFEVLQDEASIVAVSALVGELYACRRLALYRLAQNPLIGDVELKVGLKARFQTEELITKPLCGRVFQYPPDDVVIAWNNSEAIPAGKVRSIPKVYPDMESLQIRPGPANPLGSSGQQNALFTFLYVHHYNGSDMERPFVHWLVTNMKNFDTNTGDTSVAYLEIVPPIGQANGNLLVYRQSRQIEIYAGDYASDWSCFGFQFRCGWDIEKLVRQNDLELVGALSFNVQVDAFSAVDNVELNLVDPAMACTWTTEYKHEGRMLGQCLSKFDAWKTLMQEIRMLELRKRTIVEKMSMMCPELGSK